MDGRVPETTSGHWNYFSTTPAAWFVDHELDRHRCCSAASFVTVAASPVSDGCKTDFAGTAVHDVRLVSRINIAGVEGGLRDKPATY